MSPPMLSSWHGAGSVSGRGAWMPRRLLRAALCSGLFGWPVAVDGKWVHGSVSLEKGKAVVLTKFCFDFDPKCRQDCKHAPPGIINTTIFSAHRDDCESKSCTGKGPDIRVALLDDEYYSFPEVSQVWDRLGCTEITKAAKSNFGVNWKQASSANGTKHSITVSEKVRPRWWFVAVASCSDHRSSFSYSIHLRNMHVGSDAEFSFDAVGIRRFTFYLSIMFAAVTALQVSSTLSWKGSTRTAGWGQVHPVLLLALAASSLATFGQVCWLTYFRHFEREGHGGDLWALAGRGGVVASRVLVSLILMLLARGECVCSPHITWSAHKEIVQGLAVFGVLSYGLELYGESELRSTATEYVYDTQPGMILVAFDVLWMWLYASRAWLTFRIETRLKARRFYRQYAAVFFLWFASLPFVAALAQVLSPWVRYFITCAVNGSVHVLTLGLLVYTLHPRVAGELYDLQATTYAKLGQEDLSGTLDDMDEDI